MKSMQMLALFSFVLLATFLCAADFFLEDFSNVAEAGKRLQLEHGSAAGMRFEDGKVILDNEGVRQGVRCRLAVAQFAECDLEFKMQFLNEIPRGGYAGVILQRERPSAPGLGVSLTDSSGHLQVALPPDFATEYIQIAHPRNIQHTIRIVVKGGKLRITVDGQVVLDRSGFTFKAGDICLRTWDTKVAFDDIAIRSPEETRLELHNVLPNGSFEDAVSPNMPYAWGLAAWGLAEDKLLGDLEKFRSEWRRDTENPKHGKYCMRVGMTNLLASCFFPIQAGADYMLTAWVRGKTPGKLLNVRYYCRQGSQYEYKVKTVSLTEQWQRVCWPLPPTNLSSGAVYFYGPEDEEYYVDAVTITLGKEIPEDYIENVNVEKDADSPTDIPEIQASRISTSPSLEELLDDPAWQNATRFHLQASSGGEPVEKTDGFLMYNDDCLYIGMRCWDSQMQQVRANVTKRDGFVWQDDCVELFIGPAGHHKDWNDYFHLGVSITGAVYDAHKMDPSWNMEWRARTGRNQDGWEMVAEIPFKSLNLHDACRGDWAINFCRENAKSHEFSAWSPTYGNFHAAERFGTLKAFPADVLNRCISSSGTESSQSNLIPVVPMMKDGKPYLPFGITWESIFLPGESIFREMKKNGMNHFLWAVSLKRCTPEDIRKTLNYAQQYGIDVSFWIWGGDGMGIPIEQRPEFNADVIRKYKDHPAIFSWMVLDEPHDHGDVVEAAVREAKQVDPDRPVFINVTPHGLGMRIGGLPGDILSFDRYVFSFDGSTLPDVGITARTAAKIANERPRPVLAILQGMGHCLWVPRCPTPDEMTAQSYLALVSGCSGFVFFNAMVLAEDTWERMQELSSEFQQLFPIVLSKDIPIVECRNRDICFMARKYLGKTYLIAVNQTQETVHTAFDFQEKLAQGKEVFSEKRCPRRTIN